MVSDAYFTVTPRSEDASLHCQRLDLELQLRWALTSAICCTVLRKWLMPAAAIALKIIPAHYSDRYWGSARPMAATKLRSLRRPKYTIWVRGSSNYLPN